MSGLGRIGVKLLEIQFPSDQEHHGAHGCESGIPLSLAFGHLEQPVEGFEQAVGLAGLDKRHDPLEMLTDCSGDCLIGSTLDCLTSAHH